MQNVLVSLSISPFNGDTASPWPIVIFIVAAVIILGVLFMTRKKK